MAENALVRTAIERLKAFEPEEGYYLAFSGGKDSVTVKALMDMAGVKYDAVYRVTSVDPPELVRFVKEYHPDVACEIPRDKEGNPYTMWNLIPRKMMPPTKVARYCCEFLKESGGDGRMTVTGVRWAESTNRKLNQGSITVMSPKKALKDEMIDSGHFAKTNKRGVILVNDNAESRRMIEQCYKRSKVTLNPIIDWTDKDVWCFIRENSVPYCSLYDEGWHRLGCIGCPMASTEHREKAFRRWPKYKAAYLRAFDKMLKLRTERHEVDPARPVWISGGYEGHEPTAQDVFDWWMEYDRMEGQMRLVGTEVDEDDA